MATLMLMSMLANKYQMVIFDTVDWFYFASFALLDLLIYARMVRRN